jgi:hypothetical protein
MCMKWDWKVVRDPAFFLLGAFVFIHEVLATGTERPTILAAALALMGVPAFLRRDEAVAGKEAKAVQEVLARNRLEQAGRGERADQEET